MYKWEKANEKGKELPVIQLSIDDLTKEERRGLESKEGRVVQLGISCPDAFLRTGHILVDAALPLEKRDSGYGALHIFLENDGEQTRYQLDFQQEGAERFFEHVVLDNGVQSGYIAKGAEMSKEFAKIAATAITHIPEVLLKEGNFQNREFYLERIPDRSL